MQILHLAACDVLNLVCSVMDLVAIIEKYFVFLPSESALALLVVVTCVFVSAFFQFCGTSLCFTLVRYS